MRLRRSRKLCWFSQNACQTLAHPYVDVDRADVVLHLTIPGSGRLTANAAVEGLRAVWARVRAD